MPGCPTVLMQKCRGPDGQRRKEWSLENAECRMQNDEMNTVLFSASLRLCASAFHT
jgi:hypothetical protein